MPRPPITYQTDAQYQTAKLHFDWIRQNYKSIFAVNLIEKHGQLKELGQRYESVLQSAQIKSRWFDFHAECKNRAYHKLDELADSLADTLNDYGFF